MFKEYRILIYREYLPRLVSFLTHDDKINYEDSITLSSIFNTLSISSDGINKTFISGQLLEIFQNVANYDLLNIISSSNENLNLLDIEYEKKISNLTVKLPLLNGGKFFIEEKL